MRIHHIGYLVKNIEKAIRTLEATGYTVAQGVVYDRYREVDIAFLERDGYTIELVSPKTESSVVAGLIKRYKNAPYHICYVSDDFSHDVEKLCGGGYRQIDEPTPAPALGGRNVCFFMSPAVGMIELLDGEQ